MNSQNRQIWILPDLNQDGDLEIIIDGEKGKLCDELDIKIIPKELVLGVPEELIRKYGPEEPIYSQIVRDGIKKYFIISTSCGKDKDGRIIHLSFLNIINVGDNISLELTTDGLPEEPKKRVDIVNARIENKKDLWVKRLEEMINYSNKHPSIRYLVNWETPNAFYSPDWPLKKNFVSRYSVVIALIITILVAVIGYYLIFNRTSSLANI